MMLRILILALFSLSVTFSMAHANPKEEQKAHKERAKVEKNQIKNLKKNASALSDANRKLDGTFKEVSSKLEEALNGAQGGVTLKKQNALDKKFYSARNDEIRDHRIATDEFRKISSKLKMSESYRKRDMQSVGIAPGQMDRLQFTPQQVAAVSVMTFRKDGIGLAQRKAELAQERAVAVGAIHKAMVKQGLTLDTARTWPDEVINLRNGLVDTLREERFVELQLDYLLRKGARIFNAMRQAAADSGHLGSMETNRQNANSNDTVDPNLYGTTTQTTSSTFTSSTAGYQGNSSLSNNNNNIYTAAPAQPEQLRDQIRARQQQRRAAEIARVAAQTPIYGRLLPDQIDYGILLPNQQGGNSNDKDNDNDRL